MTSIRKEDLDLIPPYTSMVNPSNEQFFADYVNRAIAEATVLIKCQQECGCGGGHHMAWPGAKDGGEYVKLTSLPQCPMRILCYATNIHNHEKVMRELRYED